MCYHHHRLKCYVLCYVACYIMIHVLYINHIIDVYECQYCGWHRTLQWSRNERDGVSNHRRLYCLLRRKSKKTSKLCVTGLCEGKPLVAGGFPSQRASNADNASISSTSSWWTWSKNAEYCWIHHIIEKHAVSMLFQLIYIYIYVLRSILLKVNETFPGPNYKGSRPACTYVHHKYSTTPWCWRVVLNSTDRCIFCGYMIYPSIAVSLFHRLSIFPGIGGLHSDLIIEVCISFDMTSKFRLKTLGNTCVHVAVLII